MSFGQNERPVKRIRLDDAPHMPKVPPRILLESERLPRLEDELFAREHAEWEETSSQMRHRLRLEDICQRYSVDYGDDADEINIRTGEIVVDKGHWRDLPDAVEEEDYESFTSEEDGIEDDHDDDILDFLRGATVPRVSEELRREVRVQDPSMPADETILQLLGPVGPAVLEILKKDARERSATPISASRTPGRMASMTPYPDTDEDDDLTASPFVSETPLRLDHRRTRVTSSESPSIIRPSMPPPKAVSKTKLHTLGKRDVNTASPKLARQDVSDKSAIVRRAKLKTHKSKAKPAIANRSTDAKGAVQPGPLPALPVMQIVQAPPKNVPHENITNAPAVVPSCEVPDDSSEGHDRVVSCESPQIQIANTILPAASPAGFRSPTSGLSRFRAIYHTRVSQNEIEESIKTPLGSLIRIMAQSPAAESVSENLTESGKEIWCFENRESHHIQAVSPNPSTMPSAEYLPCRSGSTPTREVSNTSVCQSEGQDSVTEPSNGLTSAAQQIASDLDDLIPFNWPSENILDANATQSPSAVPVSEVALVSGNEGHRVVNRESQHIQDSSTNSSAIPPSGDLPFETDIAGPSDISHVSDSQQEGQEPIRTSPESSISGLQQTETELEQSISAGLRAQSVLSDRIPQHPAVMPVGDVSFVADSGIPSVRTCESPGIQAASMNNSAILPAEILPARIGHTPTLGMVLPWAPQSVVQDLIRVPSTDLTSVPRHSANDSVYITPSHGQYHECRVCGAMFPTLVGLQQHELQGGRRILCPSEGCDHSYTQMHNLTRHLDGRCQYISGTIDHSAKRKPLISLPVCPYEKQFQPMIRRFRCPNRECGHAYTQSHNLKRHLDGRCRYMPITRRCRSFSMESDTQNQAYMDSRVSNQTPSTRLVDGSGSLGNDSVMSERSPSPALPNANHEQPGTQDLRVQMWSNLFSHGAPQFSTPSRTAQQTVRIHPRRMSTVNILSEPVRDGGTAIIAPYLSDSLQQLPDPGNSSTQTLTPYTEANFEPLTINAWVKHRELPGSQTEHIVEKESHGRILFTNEVSHLHFDNSARQVPPSKSRPRRTRKPSKKAAEKAIQGVDEAQDREKDLTITLKGNTEVCDSDIDPCLLSPFLSSDPSQQLIDSSRAPLLSSASVTAR